MKYLKASFKNYIGFFNGMGLYEVSIDFTKCKHDIILISGMNGSGKSTLLFHLNPFPDGSSSFIPDKSAEKDLVLFSNGDTYSIQIYSPVDLKGRKTTKAYIQKNGVELNENGNVSSYKDIIFSEFELDSNYISLSRLSSTDRGLGDKTPAERKKFVANIIDNLEIYNSMYKTLNKKSLIYKSHLGTLHTKIQNIGSKEMLDTRLRALKLKEAELSGKILEINNRIVAIQAKNSIDEDEARAIQEANSICDSLKVELDNISSRLDMFYNKTKIQKEDIDSKYNSSKELQTTYKNKVEQLTNNWMDHNDRLALVTESKLNMEANLSSSITNEDVGERYSAIKEEISGLEKEFKDILGVKPDISFMNKLSSLVAFSEKFIRLVDSFYDNIDASDIELLVNNNNIKENITFLMNKQNNVLNTLSATKDKLSELNANMKTLSILDNRPKKCKIDSCPFISEALSLKKSMKIDIMYEISSLQAQCIDLSKSSTEIQNDIDHISELTPKSMELGRIRELVSENKDIVKEFYPMDLSNNLITMNPFNFIRDYSKYNDALNILTILSDLYNKRQVLEVEYKGYQEKIQILNTSKKVLEDLKVEEKELVETISKMKSEIDEYKDTLSKVENNLNIEFQYKSTYDDYISKKNEYDLAYKKVEEYNKKSSKALELLSSINDMKADIDKMNIELNPVKSDISTITGQLTLLDSYYIEYNRYKDSFDRIEVLKKYCSPTGGGIQTLFIQLYMSKTKQLANDVLAMLFNGVYQLQDFIINESEFRIPFIGEGLPVDDISSGSASQISMMSLIINLVLLHQASTKFNIAFLDEIESALDGYNRTNFVNVLFHSINILGIEQLFLISHSIEVDNTFADIIQLKGYENFDSITNSGNVIWDYNEAIKET